MLFAAAQVHYARKQHLAEVSKSALAAEDVEKGALKVILDASRTTPPLPKAVAAGVRAAREQLEETRKAGGGRLEIDELKGLADALLLEKNATEKLAVFQREHPSRQIPYLALGYAYFTQEKYHEAETTLGTGAERFPNSAAFFGHRAHALLRQRNPDAALRDAEHAVDLNQGSPYSHFVLGLSLMETGRDDEALQAFVTASRLAPDWHEPHLAIASIYAERHELELALKHVEEGLASAPDEPRLRLTKAALLDALGSGATLEAVNEAREAQPVNFTKGFGYTGVFVWTSDLPKLDEFNGDFLLNYQKKNQEWEPDEFQLPLLRALCATRSVAKFFQFEEALFDICVTPVYHIGSNFGAAQMIRLTNRTPQCLLHRGIVSVWMTEESLRLSPQDVPWRPMPKVDSARLNAFFGRK